MKKIKEISFDLTSVFSRLFIVILMGNFYQFALLKGRAFWANLIEEKKVHKKSF